jgi:hypothetical protein
MLMTDKNKKNLFYEVGRSVKKKGYYLREGGQIVE